MYTAVYLPVYTHLNIKMCAKIMKEYVVATKIKLKITLKILRCVRGGDYLSK